MIHTKFCFLISNHYAKITEINKPLVVCKERKSFQIHPIKLFWIQSFHALQNQLYLVVFTISWLNLSMDFQLLILLFIQSINELLYLLWIHKYFCFIIRNSP